MFQGGACVEGDVGGDFDLVGHPVVAAEAGLGEHRQVGVDPVGEVVEQPGPAAGGQLVGQALGGLPVAHAHKAVAGPQVAAPVAVHGSGQHLVTVGPDLDLKREPGLEADVAEAELVVDHIQVELTALAAAADNLETMSGPVALDVKRSARLHRREHADQPGSDAVTIGDLSGQVLFGMAGGFGVVVRQVLNRDDRRRRRDVGRWR